MVKMIKINDLMQEKKEAITFAKFKKELNTLLLDLGIKIEKIDKAMSGSKYICFCMIEDENDEYNFIRIANHNKSFQSEGFVSVITDEKNVYAEILNYIKTSDVLTQIINYLY